MSRVPTIPLAERELVRAHELAALLGVSRATILERDREERLPAPIRDWAGVQWRVAEIRAWLAAGAPDRDRWTWAPTRLQKLDELLAERRIEILQAQRERDAIQREIDEKLTTLRTLGRG